MIKVLIPTKSVAEQLVERLSRMSGGPFDIVQGRYVGNARNLLSVLSFDMSEPMYIRATAMRDIDLATILRRFIDDEEFARVAVESANNGEVDLTVEQRPGEGMQIFVSMRGGGRTCGP